ncbi:sensor histidine kinase [Lacinutrix iliipiscaria]|uniref:histidine kinase n=1 Tax=Lacinutrix iliipiscaria TaxID=1230532 RepID=A0ABW5WLT4_9FLAO
MLLTIVVQCYWNYKNYLQNKQHFINQVQISLDNALEAYYANLAEANHMTFIDIPSDTLHFDNKLKLLNTDSLILTLQNDYKSEFEDDLKIKGITQLIDSTGYTYSSTSDKLTQIKVIKGKKASDSIKLLKGITSIFISIQDDSLNFSKLNPLLSNELKRKKFDIPYALKHYRNDSLINSYNPQIIQPDFLNTTSKTKFLKQNESLSLTYPNATKLILRQGLSGILLSLLFTFAIISCLFYLLKTIKHQKQLAEVKNDLISNITHEFKTPISTIGIALESIKDFKVINDKEKTKDYINMSTSQLNKLNIMVEKLLETATLDNNGLKLVKEDINIISLLNTIIEKHTATLHNKTINFKTDLKNLMAKVDGFHFENAINNILDNAIKYGGDLITINLTQNKHAFTILISDNGNSLNSSHKDKIFEKFYRVPKGNIHDIKGFGIGLYYTKKIIEKHDGTIQLELNHNLTTFKLSLPHE